MTQTNGHIGLGEAGVSFAGWPRSEVEFFLKTVGRFVASQTQPLKKEIEGLKSQIEELQTQILWCPPTRVVLQMRSASYI